MEIEPAVVEVQTIIRPKLERLIEYVADQAEPIAPTFFTDLLVQLIEDGVEEDLLAWCIKLSKTAFVGIQFDTVSWALADEILADAERISKTFLASEETPH